MVVNSGDVPRVVYSPRSHGPSNGYHNNNASVPKGWKRGEAYDESISTIETNAVPNGNQQQQNFYRSEGMPHQPPMKARTTQPVHSPHHQANMNISVPTSNRPQQPLSPRSTNVLNVPHGHIPAEPQSRPSSPNAGSPRDTTFGHFATNEAASMHRLVSQTTSPQHKSSHVSSPSAGGAAPMFAPSQHPPAIDIDAQSIRRSAASFHLFLDQLVQLHSSHHYLTIQELLLKKTTEEQRKAFAYVLKTKTENLPTFPEAGENDALSKVREMNALFGPSLAKLVAVEGGEADDAGGKMEAPVAQQPQQYQPGAQGEPQAQQHQQEYQANAQPNAAQIASPRSQSQMNGSTASRHIYNEAVNLLNDDPYTPTVEDVMYQEGAYGQQQQYQGHQAQQQGGYSNEYQNNHGRYGNYDQTQQGQYQGGQYAQQSYHNDNRGEQGGQEFDYSRMDDTQQTNWDERRQEQYRQQASAENHQYVPPSVPEDRSQQQHSNNGRWQESNWKDDGRNGGESEYFQFTEGETSQRGNQNHHHQWDGQQRRQYSQVQGESNESYGQRDHRDQQVHRRGHNDQYDEDDRHHDTYRRNDQHSAHYDTETQYNEDGQSIRSKYSKMTGMTGISFDNTEKQSQLREKLLEEMEHVARILKSTTNNDVRKSHVLRLKELREEWEDLKNQGDHNLSSPTKSTLGMAGVEGDGHTHKSGPTRSGISSKGSTSSRSKAVSKKLWRGEQILLRDPHQMHGGNSMHDDKSIGLKSARSMGTHAKSIFGDDTRSVATAPASRPMGKRTVNVVAPETLPAGFTFEARLGDHVFMATVPEGGVAKGEVFASVINDIDERADKASVRVRTLIDMGGPRTRWRDELFDCFSEGCFHPLLLNSCFCGQVALSQIMARMQMTSNGQRGVTLNSRFRVMQVVWLTFGVFALHVLYAVPVYVRSPQTPALYLISFIPLVAMDIGILLYFWYLVARTRKAMRDEYDIPQIHCKCCDAEDACMAVCCTSCTLAQMGRHTADYTTYRSMCCTDTGLPNHVEVKLPSDPLNDVV